MRWRVRWQNKKMPSWIIMAAAFLAATVFQVNVVYIVIASGLLGFLRSKYRERGKYHDLSEIIFCISSDWNVSFGGGYAAMPLIQLQVVAHVSLVRWERVRRSCHDLADDTWPDRHKCSYVCRNEHGRACGSSDCNVWMYSAVLYFGYIYCLLLFKISKARSTSGCSFFPASGSDRTDRSGPGFLLVSAFWNGQTVIRLPDTDWGMVILFGLCIVLLRKCKMNPVTVMFLAGYSESFAGRRSESFVKFW